MLLVTPHEKGKYQSMDNTKIGINADVTLRQSEEGECL